MPKKPKSRQKLPKHVPFALPLTTVTSSTLSREGKSALNSSIAAIRYWGSPCHASPSLTGVRAYMSGKIKVRGDLMLAQKLEEIFNKTGGQEVSIFITVLGRYNFCAPSNARLFFHPSKRNLSTPESLRVFEAK